jgi:hypothetical protein
VLVPSRPGRLLSHRHQPDDRVHRWIASNGDGRGGGRQGRYASRWDRPAACPLPPPPRPQTSSDSQRCTTLRNHLKGVTTS